jgi:hypothetical protein
MLSEEMRWHCLLHPIKIFIAGTASLVIARINTHTVNAADNQSIHCNVNDALCWTFFFYHIKGKNICGVLACSACKYRSGLGCIRNFEKLYQKWTKSQLRIHLNGKKMIYYYVFNEKFLGVWGLKGNVAILNFSEILYKCSEISRKYNELLLNFVSQHFRTHKGRII